MSSKKSKDYLVIFITLLIDISLVSLILLNKIKTHNDYVYIYTLFIIHSIFIYAILYHKTTLIDIIHIGLTLSFIIVLFINSFYLKLIHLVLLIVIQFSWYIFGGCIISFSFSNGNLLIPYWIAALWTLVLIYNLYHPFT
jgi:hypothetical protein